MIKKIDKFEKNNPSIAVNALFNNIKSQKKSIYNPQIRAQQEV